MSVFPYLNIGNKYSGSVRYEFVLSNEGIGPALVDSVTVVTKSGLRYPDIVDYVEDNLSEEDSIYIVHSNIHTGQLIPAKEEIPLIKLIDDNLLKELGYDKLGLPENTVEGSYKMKNLLNHDSVTITITYKSIYGEKWKITSHSIAPEKIE